MQGKITLTARELHGLLNQGADPASKAAAAEDPSRVAFLLMRAPNEAGKWRYLLQKRDDETWGLPGGGCHEGEAPWQAAVREAAEELGDLPPVKAAAQWSRPGDGHVVWTYLVELPEMFAPSADGETSDETAGWGWFRRRDVEDLPLHPAMRETWEALDFGEPLLGGEAPGAAKRKGGHGNAETLREYWTHEAHGGPSRFAYADEIAWGTPGDFARCTRLVMEHAGMTEGQAHGFCNLLHHRALGFWPAQHAAMEREGK